MSVSKLNRNGITPFGNCPALDGYHCQTNSLAKIFHYYNCPLSEDMLLGLGAGMGFMYWHQKGMSPFIGGRGNVKNFFQDLGKRTSVTIKVISTSIEKKAERALLDNLLRKEPLMVYADMGFLPWFDLPEGYHFGGHTFVVCGYDGQDTVLASDMDQKASGLKRGFYSPITLEQLRKARNSPYRPFPPKNAYLEFDFGNYHPPNDEDIYSSINQTIHSMLNPPISNFGVEGIRRSAKEITKWPCLFNEKELRLNLFTIYIFIEIGGTGGGCFRYMYSRFLKEAAEITSNKALEAAASMIFESGKHFSELGQLFDDAETAIDIEEKIRAAEGKFITIADMEEEAFQNLAENIPSMPTT
ncbi:MAG: BtrH N-terminal domain-containing protein [Candidatus Bathyarchaeota archaeon]|nr:MAG: BtrH N-terminal domain-containing protein [Candidatus Bathyarchaeota archaeon]